MGQAADRLEGGDREGDAHGHVGQGYAGQTADWDLVKGVIRQGGTEDYAGLTADGDLCVAQSTFIG